MQTCLKSYQLNTNTGVLVFLERLIKAQAVTGFMAASLCDVKGRDFRKFK